MNAEMLRRRRRRYSSECGLRRGRGRGHGRLGHGWPPEIGVGGMVAAAILAGIPKRRSREGNDGAALGRSLLGGSREPICSY